MTQTQTETPARPKLEERELILANLAQFIRQRPGIDPRNYISHWQDANGRRAYRQEVRSVTRDLHHARQLLAAVSWRTGIDAEALKAALHGAYSGRLSWIPGGTVHEDSPARASSSPYGRLVYCTGQYFPTEYRRAVCAVLASALWSYFRDQCGAKTGDDVRKMARRELDAPLAKRWFS
jgi:hypothetical protein